MLSKYLSVWSSISRDIHDIFSKLHPSSIPVEKLRQFSSFAEVKGYILSVQPGISIVSGLGGW